MRTAIRQRACRPAGDDGVLAHPEAEAAGAEDHVHRSEARPKKIERDKTPTEPKEQLAELDKKLKDEPPDETKKPLEVKPPKLRPKKKPPKKKKEKKKEEARGRARRAPRAGEERGGEEGGAGEARRRRSSRSRCPPDFELALKMVEQPDELDEKDAPEEFDYLSNVNRDVKEETRARVTNLETGCDQTQGGIRLEPSERQGAAGHRERAEDPPRIEGGHESQLNRQAVPKTKPQDARASVRRAKRSQT